jgi:hypothetical protein
MPYFRVYEANSKGRAFALHDSDGLCHVARSLEDMPQVGADLEGPAPELGSSTLQCAASGRDYPVVFDAVGWDRQATLEHLHPRLIRGVMPALP